MLCAGLSRPGRVHLSGQRQVLGADIPYEVPVHRGNAGAGLGKSRGTSQCCQCSSDQRPGLV